MSHPEPVTPGSLWGRRSMRWFFLVGFGLPWLGWTTRAVFDAQGALARALFYTGDFMAVAGFVATWVAAGKPGLVSLARRFFAIRAPILWAVFALLIPIVWNTLATVAYGLTHDGVGRIEPAGLLGFFTVGTAIAATTGPIGEEAGWRGYFLPRLLTRYPPMVTCLVLGTIWSVWHYPIYYNAMFGTVAGAIMFTIAVICFSVLLMVLWAFTNGSIFWAMVLHWSINVTPDVMEAVLPDVRFPEGGIPGTNLLFLVLTTVAVASIVGPRRLQARLDTVVAGLREREAVDADRRA